MSEENFVPLKFRYIKNFDGIRGIAVLFVLLYHGSYGFCKGGWIGVDLFFIMSGYLITSLLKNEFSLTGNISFTKFYMRRILRLFPALIICIAFANILWSFTDSLHSKPNEILATLGGLFYFTNILNGSLTGNMSHLWSLSVEEHFYFFWPILCYTLIFVLSYRKKIAFLLAVIVAVISFRIFVFYHQDLFNHGIISLDSNRFTLCKIDELILGSLLVFLPLKDNLLSKFIQQFAVAITILLLSIFVITLFTVNEFSPIWRSGGFLLTNGLCLFTVYIAILIPNSPLFSNNSFVWLGKRSYGIYLYHVPIFLFMENFRIHNSNTNLLIITIVRFVLAICIAAFSYEWIEKPILKFKEKFEVKK